MQEIWRIIPSDIRAQYHLIKELGILPVTAKILVNRGIKDPVEARSFLEAGLNNLCRPFLMKDLQKAVQIIKEALQSQEKIFVYGDYDVDGITGTTILVDFLRGLGAVVDYYIPDRLEDGYGIHPTVLKEIIDKGYRVLITVDCGTSAVEEFSGITKQGLKVIITDHHQPPPELPTVDAILNPKRPGCTYPFKELAGVGVVFKLVQALSETYNLSAEHFLKYLDLAALGTVADLVPLIGENRILVKHGLKRLRCSSNEGLSALLEFCGLKDKPLKIWHLSFILAPKINAVGRIGSAQTAVRLFLTDDPDKIHKLIKILKRQNDKRQQMVKQVTEAAKLQAAEEIDWEKERVIVLASPDWHPGVIGIAAARLTEKFNCPVFLFSISGETARGSARGPQGINLYTCLYRCHHLLTKFGGHERAAGLTLPVACLPELRRDLNRIVHEFNPETFKDFFDLDTEIAPDELTEELAVDIEKLAPFGCGNPEPLFVCTGRRVLDLNLVGKNHLKLNFFYGDRLFEAIGFRLGHYLDRVREGDKLNLAFTLGRNEWQGQSRLQLYLKKLSKSFCLSPKTAKTTSLVFEDVTTAGKDLTGAKNVLVSINQTSLERKLIKNAAFGGNSTKLTLVFYPLRSLVELEYKSYALEANNSVWKLNSNVSQKEREDFFDSFSSERSALVLTTLEFVAYYKDKFMAIKERIGRLIFVLPQMVKQVNQLRIIVESLGRPPLLILTSHEEIGKDLPFSIDRYYQLEEPLPSIDYNDLRQKKPKDLCLKEILQDADGPVLVYTSLIREAVRLAAHEKISFFDSAMSDERKMLYYRMLEGGYLKALVTNGWGELPAERFVFRDLVFYQPCFSHLEFLRLLSLVNNQVTVHFLFNAVDIKLNRVKLYEHFPEREHIKKCYLVLRNLAGSGTRGVCFRELVKRLSRYPDRLPVIRLTFNCLEVLRELNLIYYESEGSDIKILLLPEFRQKIELTRSLLFAEGLKEKNEFEDYTKYLLISDVSELVISKKQKSFCS